jgi:predicted nuclease of predicted toxin-antitoxin system
MRLLFDQNISFRITKKLKSYFSDCKHVSDCGLSDCDDPEIWEYAQENDYAIVTFNSDFYEISLIKGYPPKIIWIRSGNLTTTQIAGLLIKNKESIIEFISKEEFKDMACIELES